MKIQKENIIYQLYSNVVVVNYDGTTYTAKDSSGNDVSIDMSAVEAEFTKQDYINKRIETGSKTYGFWREQLAMLYDDMLAGKLDTTGTWASHIKAVKDANPKPS
tara:strand:+ start:101 stop:415 length:315 start_codon:yes stop_codon:yes gene_type:complete